MKNQNGIYLSGGGDEQQSFPLDKFFFTTLPPQARFLYIPVALRGHELYPGSSAWMKGVLDLHDRKDLQFDTATDLTSYKAADLVCYDAIYVGGGNTWSLMQELNESGFAVLLQKYIRNGGLYYGGSAGAIILGKRIDTHDDKNHVGWRDKNGLNLLGGYSLACHFTDNQTEYFVEWATKNQSTIVCLPEDTGLFLNQDSIRCEGKKSCIIYSSEGAMEVLEPGESISK